MPRESFTGGEPDRPPKNNAIRVMLVDDHPAFRRGMSALIESEPDLQVVAEAGDGRDAVELFRQKKPDVVLMDLRLPGMGGVEATLAIRKEFPQARIIILTTFDADEDIYRAIQSGAQSYLLKDTPEDELAATIRAVHAGQPKLSSKVAARLAARQQRPDLSPREMQVQQGNRQRPVRLRRHGQGAFPLALRQARRAGPHRGRHRGHPPWHCATELNLPPKFIRRAAIPARHGGRI
jgi:two-component system NarL family response regulator